VSAAELERSKGLQSDARTPVKDRLRRARASGGRLFTKAAPRDVRKHAAAGRQDDEWEAWSRYLAKRRSRDRLAALVRKFGPDVYLMGSQRPRRLCETLFAALGGDASSQSAANDDVRRALEPLLAAGIDDDGEEVAYLALVATYLADKLAAALGRDVWWPLIESLYQIALDADGLDLTARPVVHQLCAGELRIALACRLGEIAPLAELWTKGRRALSAGMEELLDDEGLPHARHLPHQRALVGAWTRAKLLASKSPEAPWDDDCEAQYPLAVRELLRLRGQVDLLLPAAVWASRSKQNRRLLEVVLPRSQRKQFGSSLLRRAKANTNLPPPAHHSQWAQLAVMRPDWKRSSPRLTVSYADRSIGVDFGIGREAVFSGKWDCVVTVDDRPAAPTGEWEEICWVSDEDVDYLEIEMPLEQGLVVQRQICLARNDQFLFLADAVIGGKARSMQYRGRLPIAAGIEARPADKTREIELSGRKTTALLMPLALGEWRVDRRAGEINVAERSLELVQQASAARLYAPLWIDLAARRQKKAFTWRQLTVAEHRQSVARDVAAGYRVQFGKKQWLVYRSLAERGNRTVLGHNLSTEFLIARFGRDGSVKPLFEIE
jgi:hypothetical protein